MQHSHKNTHTGISLDPGSEALSLIGSQEGFANLLLGVTDVGDSVLMCDVCYPSYFGALKVGVFVFLRIVSLPSSCDD